MEKLRSPGMKVRFSDPYETSEEQSEALLSAPKKQKFVISKDSPGPQYSKRESGQESVEENASVKPKKFTNSEKKSSSGSSQEKPRAVFSGIAMKEASQANITAKYASHRDVGMRVLPKNIKKQYSARSIDNPMIKSSVALSGISQLKNKIQSQLIGLSRLPVKPSEEVLINRMNENFLDENFMENEKEYIYKTWNHIKRSSLVNFTRYKKSAYEKKVKLSDFTIKESIWKNVLEKKKSKNIMRDVCLQYEYSPDYCFNSIIDVLNSYQLIKPIAAFINEGIAKDGKEIPHNYSARLFKFPRDSLHTQDEFPESRFTDKQLIEREQDIEQNDYIHPFQRMAPSEGTFGRKNPLKLENDPEYINTETNLLSSRRRNSVSTMKPLADRHHIATNADVFNKKAYLLIKSRSRPEFINPKKMEKSRRPVPRHSEMQNLQTLFKPIQEMTQFKGRRQGRRKALYEQTNVAAILDKFLNDFVEIDKAVVKVEEHDEVELLYEGMRAKEAHDMVCNDMNWSGEQVLSTQHYPEYLTKKVIKALNTQDIMIWMSSFGGFRKLLHKRLRRLSNSVSFEVFMMACTLTNILVLLIEGFLGPELKRGAAQINFALTFVYQIELLLKLWAFGIKIYGRSFVNLIEGLVAIIATVEISLTTTGSSFDSDLRYLSAFRVVRLVRLLGKLRFMAVISAVVYQTLEQYTYVALILFLFVFIFSLIGMQIFGGQLIYQGNLPRQNFDTIGGSFLLLFQLLTLENWTDIVEILYSSKVSKPLTLVYFFIWILIGNFVMFNLFLALLLSGFDNTDIMASVNEERDEYRQILDETIEKYEAVAKQNQAIIRKIEKQEKNIQDILEEETGHNLIKEEVRYVTEFDKERHRYRAVYFPVRNTIDDESSLELLFDDTLKSQIVRRKSKYSMSNTDVIFSGVRAEYSLGVFSKDNSVRRFCALVVSHPFFAKGIMALIVISTLQLVVQSYLDDKNESKVLEQVFEYTEIIFLFIFAVEAIFKIVRGGLINDKCAYLRDPWCWLELFIVVGSSLDYLFSDSRFEIARVSSVK